MPQSSRVPLRCRLVYGVRRVERSATRNAKYRSGTACTKRVRELANLDVAAMLDETVFIVTLILIFNLGRGACERLATCMALPDPSKGLSVPLPKSLVNNFKR